MNWPNSFVFIRHGRSEFQEQADALKTDPDYIRLQNLLEKHGPNDGTRYLAIMLDKRYPLRFVEKDIALTEVGKQQALKLGKHFAQNKERLPDCVIVSPLLRAVQTYQMILEGWPALSEAPRMYDERLTEQNHGEADKHANWLTYLALHPKEFFEKKQRGDFFYAYPGGQRLADVSAAVRALINSISEDYSGKNVWLITSYFPIKCAISYLDERKSKRMNPLPSGGDPDKPINCGVTRFRFSPERNRLIPTAVNTKHY